jgi:hypothetical protein
MSSLNIIKNVWNLIDDDSNWDNIWDMLFKIPIITTIDIFIYNKIIINILKSLFELNLFSNISDGIISMINTTIKYMNNNRNPFKNNMVLLHDIMNVFNQYEIDKSQLFFLRLPDDAIINYSEFVLDDVYKIILSDNNNENFNNLQWIEFLKTDDFKNILFANKNININYIKFTYYDYILINDNLNINNKEHFHYSIYSYILMGNNDFLLDHFIDVWNGDFYELWKDDNIVVELVVNPNDKIIDLITDDLIAMYKHNISFWVGLSTNLNIRAINILQDHFDDYINFFLDENFLIDDDYIRFLGLFLSNPTTINLIFENMLYLNTISDNDIIIKLLAKNPHDKAIEYIINEWDNIDKNDVFWENLAYNNNDKALKLLVDNWIYINKTNRFWELLAENTSDKALKLIIDNLQNIKSNVNIWLSLARNTNKLVFNLIIDNWNYIMDIMDENLYLFFLMFIKNQPVFVIDVDKTNEQKDELNIIYNKIRSNIF